MRSLLAVAVSLLMLGVMPASATTYTGSLTYTAPLPPGSDDGIYVIGIPGQWPDYDVSMSWTVTDEDPYDTTYLWKYTYTFDLEYSDTWGAISHIIIEGSEGIGSGDIIGTTGALVDSVGYQAVNYGFEDMPEDMWGINFDPPTADDYFTMTWSFWSNRMPVWGDFYARCGGGPGGDEINKAYNYNNDGLGTELGFLDPNGLDNVLDDIDPTDPPSDGSIDYHILRPDSYIPEPGAMGLIVFAGLMAVRRRR
ncbi:MAG: hypothetical protein JSU68_01785 [Phycisphaerales bacterium]|nr:MAG: hypothetical protein JSU68_01785 [Phycisphaerales bacterium]